jgi:hypothetical protein
MVLTFTRPYLASPSNAELTPSVVELEAWGLRSRLDGTVGLCAELPALRSEIVSATNNGYPP